MQPSSLTTWVLSSSINNLFKTNESLHLNIIKEVIYLRNSVSNACCLIFIIADGNYSIPMLVTEDQVKLQFGISDLNTNQIKQMYNRIIQVNKSAIAVFQNEHNLYPYIIALDWLATDEKSKVNPDIQDISRNPQLKPWIQSLSNVTIPKDARPSSFFSIPDINQLFKNFDQIEHTTQMILALLYQNQKRKTILTEKISITKALPGVKKVANSDRASTLDPVRASVSSASTSILHLTFAKDTSTPIKSHRINPASTMMKGKLDPTAIATNVTLNNAATIANKTSTPVATITQETLKPAPIDIKETLNPAGKEIVYPAATSIDDEIQYSATTEEVTTVIPVEITTNISLNSISKRRVNKHTQDPVIERLVTKDTVNNVIERPVTKDTVNNLIERPVTQVLVNNLIERPVTKDTVNSMIERPVIKDTIKTPIIKKALQSVVTEKTMAPMMSRETNNSDKIETQSIASTSYTSPHQAESTLKKRKDISTNNSSNKKPKVDNSTVILSLQDNLSLLIEILHDNNTNAFDRRKVLGQMKNLYFMKNCKLE